MADSGIVGCTILNATVLVHVERGQKVAQSRKTKYLMIGRKKINKVT
jgi:hypothetical protein